MIGGSVFVAGLALQALLTTGFHVPAFLSYVIQAFLSIEASFLLNRWFTWRERDTPFWPALLRFNAQKVITVAANLTLYAVLLRLGMNYLLANILLTVAFTIINYVGGDRFVFTPGRRHARYQAANATDAETVTVQALPLIRLPASLPTVSVVIPCRANQKTIRATVDSLLAQDYPELREIILVGSPDDSTWQAVTDVSDRRLVILETKAPPGIRDANFKRDYGIRTASSDLVSLVDSDMVLPGDWISHAVTTLVDSSADCITGVMRSIHDDFWGRFVDCCRLGAKTPRVKDSYFVTAQDFGRRGRKPPISANILFTRELYRRCPIDSTWSHGSLEDYEWFWRLAASEHKVLVSSKLFGWHHHRTGLKRLFSEYCRSARGCSYFIRAHRNSPFARKRLIQAVLLPLAAVLAVAVISTAAIVDGDERQVLAVAAILVLAFVVVVAGLEFARTRTLESLAYPLPGLFLGASYTASLAMHLLKAAIPSVMTAGGAAYSTPSSAVGDHHVIYSTPEVQNATTTTVPNQISRATPHRSIQLSAWRRLGLVLAFSLCLIIGIIFRLWHLDASPAWQWDEAVYYRIGMNMQHGVLTEHTVLGASGEPFLYQPPFYFLILARWFTLIGASIYHARLLGILATSLMLVVLFRFLWKIRGGEVALFAIIPIIFDGWLLYVERASYIENILALLVVVGMLLYQRAIERPSAQRFVIAGLMLGLVAIFKQTGAYLLVAVLICWLMRRRDHKGHVMLFSAAFIIIVAYAASMARHYDSNGGDWYLYQTAVQLRRVLGLQHSGGTLTSPSALLHLLVEQYRVFIPSLLVAVSFIFVTARCLMSYYRSRKRRAYYPEANQLLLSWAVAGIVVFGISSLKFPQYFALILIPLYCLGWTELASCKWHNKWKYSVVACAVICGISSFLFSMTALSGNPFARTQQYAASHIPSNSVVVTEQAIGDLINQPWCTVEDSTSCFYVASYAITWQTYLQSSFREGDADFRLLMKGAAPVESFTGAAGTVTIWKLRR